jgi:UDP-N-acetylmuramate dehydrogenase
MITPPPPLLLKEVGLEIDPQVSLAPFTSFRVGGPAEWFCTPQTIEQVQAVYQWAIAEGLPVTFLGAGSNLLISDRGLPGLVICSKHLKHHEFDGDTGIMIADAGKPIPRLAWQAAQRGWTGFEWAVGIPGTVGGAVVMNAGAHGGCTADSLTEAHVLTREGHVQVLSNADLQYAYRSSVLQRDPQLVLRAVFQLTPGGNPAEISAQTQAHRDHRLATQPYDWPSCGSVFRNPLPKTAGWLIENSELKGYTLGGAQVSEKHANFILNLGEATASDIYHLIQHVQQTIATRWEIHLHPEVKMLGEFT